MQFHNGEEMWIHYNKAVFYNPFVNLHLACNTFFDDLRDTQTFNINDEYHQSLIITARDFLMRVRIQDLYDTASNHVFDLLEEEKPIIAETWSGPDEKEIQDIFEEYINLLDPLTMSWIDPDLADYYKGKYQFTHIPPINELDLTFIYEPETKGDWDALYEMISEKIWNMAP